MVIVTSVYTTLFETILFTSHAVNTVDPDTILIGCYSLLQTVQLDQYKCVPFVNL